MTTRCVEDIEYRLLPGSARKTTDIVIERNGTITVRPPVAYTPEQVDDVVRHKRLWIYRNLAEWRDMNACAVTRDWVDGETFLYLGRSYRLSLVAGADKDLKLRHGEFCLSRRLVENGGIDAARAAFQNFYTEKGVARVNERISRFAPKVGVEANKVRVRDTGYRWASCGKNGSLQFHWKCMMAPPRIIDYLVVHELCHLHYQSHDDAFWNEVDKVLPDYRERKEWLRRYGASLEL